MNNSLPAWISIDSDSADSFIIALHCQPGAKKTEVQGEHDGRLKLRLAAPPVEGKANEALIQWLSKKLEIRRTNIELLAGDLSRLKRVRVQGLTADQLKTILLV
ncbi:DUF167 domain-containing protein [Polynucleobacter sp. MWH-CaK5]|uniref:DUF167 domain-containing protein n=1 Tax=Polynucleobacter sp. MWH-CaK5 TaxID=2689107 RepID=UPI001BFD96A1|nr:DUF167 domain-containing protein [Polynucleobacter sp. MWH-CaK5]QWD88291.1 DUF167 domain-containing protein [Polynucleobacter sp. MWH-CaK5]